MRFRSAAVALLAVSAAFAAKADSWLRVQSPHFVVVSDGQERPARHIADQMERMRLVFQALFPGLGVDGGLPTTVLAVQNRKEFDALLPTGYTGKGKVELAGYFMPGNERNFMLMRLDNEDDQHPYRSVYFGYTEALLSQGSANLPTWLRQGLSEFYSSAEINGNDAVLGGALDQDVYILRDTPDKIPLRTLFQIGFNSPYTQKDSQANLFFAESWALTHLFVLQDRQTGAHRLSDYMALCAQNVDPVTAATRAFGDLDKLDATLEQYMRRPSFLGFHVNLAKSADANTFTAAPVSAPTADALRAEILTNNQRYDESRTLLGAALAAEPANPTALQAMGMLELRQEHRDAAVGWFEKAVKLDSQSLLANYYYAMITMQHGLDAPAAARVEASLRTAIQINPKFAPAYDRLAMLLNQQRRDLDEAHLLELNAVQLDPGQFAYRLNTANLLMTMERYDDAALVLRNARATAKSAQESAELDSQLAAIQRYSEQKRQYDAQVAAQSRAPGATRAPPQSDVAESSPVITRAPRTSIARSFDGVITAVQCAAPAATPRPMDLTLTVGSDIYQLHADDYHTVKFTAVNFIPKTPLAPCTDIKGMLASVDIMTNPDPLGPGKLVTVRLVQ